ncbi:hypothetical protein GUJ93_ZPchr0010g7531 [Zizania palustris]|uniref:glutathione transferase n=1 Tax=Zizania palustris TaxID=103762 RepID=A0A8J5WDK1_ZIZPA|nr:hypothetical protein GUJ93_ZPchr0010g7531 [Zizania palustris]
MAGLSTGAAGAPVVKVYHEKSMILPDVSRVLACLYEKDIKFETVKDSYKDILRLQATRSVPVPFYDGPTFLQESRAICRYIAEAYEQRGYPFLLGKDVLERASIEQWLRHEEHAFDPPSRALFCHLAFPLHDDDDDDINKEKRKLEEVLEVYEQRLGETEFLAGNKFSLADLFHLPNTHTMVTSERFAYMYDSRKNVQRWWNTISARDSWQQVMRDMDTVEKQYQMEEQELMQQEQQEQWQTEPQPTSDGYNIRLDPREQHGTSSRTILVRPPSAGVISTSFSPVPQEEQALPTETTPDNRPSPRTPSTPRPITPDKSKLSGFFKATSHTDETTSLRKPSPTEASRTSNEIPETRGTGEAVTPHKSSPRLTKAPHESDEHSFYKTETKPASVDPRFDKPVPYAKPTTNIPQTSYVRPSAQRDIGTSSGTEADKRSSDVRGGVQPPYAQKHADQVKKASADQRADTHLPEHVAPKDVQDESALQHQPRRTQEVKEEVPPQEQPSESKEDTHNIANEDDRFSAKRLRKMFEESEKAAKSQPQDFQPLKEETPYDGVTKPKISPPINEQEKVPVVPRQEPPARSWHASGSSNEASPDDGLAQLSTINQGRRDSAPPPNKQAALDAPSNDELAKTAGIDKRIPSSTPKQTPSDARNALAARQGAAQNNLASTQEGISGARGTSDNMFEQTSGVDQSITPVIPKKTRVQGAISDVRGTSDDDRVMNLAAGKQVASNPPKQKPVSSFQQTIEPIKGITPTSYGITGDDSAKTSITDERPAPSSEVQAPASNGQSASTVLKGGVPDVGRKNLAVKPSATDPIGMPTTPRRQEPTSETQRRHTADQVSGQAPLSSSFANTRNKENAISEADQTNTIAPDEQLGGGVPKDAGAPAVSTGSIQATSTEQTSKLQMQSGLNKPTSSKDSNETISQRSSATSREILPSVPSRSMKTQQMQGDKLSMSPQDNVKQGSEAALQGYGTGQTKKGDLANADERSSSNTEQVKSNRNSSKSDGSTKPTPFDGNESSLPESKRSGSSNNP